MDPMNVRQDNVGTWVGSIVNVVGGVLLLLFILVLVYVVGMMINYYMDPCVNKKDVWEYLIDMKFTTCYGETQTEMGAEAEFVKRELTREKEVFHISDQVYNYDQAKEKCKAYGGRLATKNEVIDAFNKGANWCSYGWTEGGEAYYPIQLGYWKRLPPNRRDVCGYPGVNGGKFPKHVRFGVNCYGVKPEGRVVIPKDPWSEPPIPFCERPENREACERSDEDHIAPFNKQEWSQYD